MNELEQILHYETVCQACCEDQAKDILIVVKDHLALIKNCVDSIYKYTKNFNLYLWDNASKEPTQQYLESLKQHNNVIVFRSEENLGFVQPNNEMSKISKSPYIILLNSDTYVREGWDRAMLGYLQANDECSLVGYAGGELDASGWGYPASNEENVDYIEGWCMCLPRDAYREYGLFDENLIFCYFEDSDLSLRLKQNGRKIYALHLPNVYHLGGATLLKVVREKEIDVRKLVKHNYDWFREKWQDFLSKKQSSTVVY